MAETFQVELVTPEQLFYSDKAEIVEAPGVEGDFAVLAQHAPLVSLLRPGMVTIHKQNSATRIFITGGLAQIDGDNCVILAENVRPLDTMTVDDAEALLVSARSALEAAITAADVAAAQKEVTGAEALLVVMRTGSLH